MGGEVGGEVVKNLSSAKLSSFLVLWFFEKEGRFTTGERFWGGRARVLRVDVCTSGC